jgi:hypothetical protein
VAPDPYNVQNETKNVGMSAESMQRRLDKNIFYHVTQSQSDLNARGSRSDLSKPDTTPGIRQGK